MSEKKEAKKFNYGVGFYWEGDSGSVGLYAYGSEIFYGTMEEAQNFRTYIENQTSGNPKSQRKYKIFQLVEVPE